MSTSWKIDCYIISMTGWSGEELLLLMADASPPSRMLMPLALENIVRTRRACERR
ncbi:MAG: hypothetical protein ABFC97_09350 [Anaerolineaceae bacterium]